MGIIGLGILSENSRVDSNTSIPSPSEFGRKVISRYMEKLGRTPLKEKINQLARSISFQEEEDVMNELLTVLSNPSHEYKKYLSVEIQKAFRTIKTFGIVPYTYIPMGASPRIVPVSYKNSLHSIKRRVRDMYLNTLGKTLALDGYRIIDVDLASCYTTILLGLYPNGLPSVMAALNSGSIWDYLKKEFVSRGLGDSYDKPSFQP